MHRAIAVFFGFAAFPALMASLAWWPLLFGGTQAAVEAARTNAYAHAFVLPGIAIIGSLLTWLFRRRFFRSTLFALALGVVAGLLTGALTFALYGKTVVEPRPFYTTVPYMGLVAAFISHGIAALCERRQRANGPKNGAA
ncbi:hypothetical protein ANRL1_02170 [Anaerolineae bacterium]|nr:hypothetical protein ANRL1_02170 [Anaerolineae bacterium]